MDSKLSVLTCLVCFLAAGFEPVIAQTVPKVSLTPVPKRAAGEAATGPELMQQIVSRISSHGTVAAKVRHRSDLFGQKLVGSGRYLQSQQRQRTQIRFSLSVKTADRTVDLLHVCDGRILWMFDTLEGKARLSRVDLPRLREAADTRGSHLPLLLGGGLPQLLGSLHADFQPSAPQSVVFQDVPVWALSLHWRPARLAHLLSRPELVDSFSGMPIETLPSQLPDRVFLLVGQDDLFPYHIDFRRSDEGQMVASGQRSPKSASHSLTTMEMFEVQFNAPLDPMQFVYSPPANIHIDDRTDEYLSQLKPGKKRK